MSDLSSAPTRTYESLRALLLGAKIDGAKAQQVLGLFAKQEYELKDVMQALAQGELHRDLSVFLTQGVVRKILAALKPKGNAT